MKTQYTPVNDDPEFIRTHGRLMYVAYLGNILKDRQLCYTARGLARLLHKNVNQGLSDWLDYSYVLPPPFLKGALYHKNMFGEFSWRGIYLFAEVCTVVKYYKLKRQVSKQFERYSTECRLMNEELEQIRRNFKREHIYGSPF